MCADGLSVRHTRDGDRAARLTVAVHVDRYNSFKFYASTGGYSRTDNNYDVIGAAWQYRWGG